MLSVSPSRENATGVKNEGWLVQRLKTGPWDVACTTFSAAMSGWSVVKSLK